MNFRIHESSPRTKGLVCNWNRFQCRPRRCNWNRFQCQQIVCNCGPPALAKAKLEHDPRATRACPPPTDKTTSHTNPTGTYVIGIDFNVNKTGCKTSIKNSKKTNQQKTRVHKCGPSGSQSQSDC